ncbi:MAG: hypothetical protein JJ891_06875 [Rhizobiaceae bacterium]|nr:hypothetical protein [Rhizobiaceae bacterium]
MKWSERRDALKTAEHEAKVAEVKARAEVAAYKVKADIEWDLKWADQASSSWKDEFILAIWSIPILGLIASMFIPPMRPAVMETLNYLQAFHPDFAEWYMAGWGIIFAATFGMRNAMSVMLPGRAARVLEASKGLKDDIPEEFMRSISK